MNRLEFFKSILLAIPLPEFLVREEKLVKIDNVNAVFNKVESEYTLGFKISKEMLSDDKYDANWFRLMKEHQRAYRRATERQYTELSDNAFREPE